MLRNIYSPLSGAQAMERKIDLISNNVANANTAGFKEDILSFASKESNPWPSYGSNIHPPAPFKMNMQELFPLRGNEMEYSVTSEAKTDFSQGGVRQTGNPLDVAIQGDGFFSVETAYGERFTRDGGFTLSTNGTLLTRGGHVVLGDNGAITGISGGDLKILETGEVYAGDRYIDKIKITTFADNSLLQKLGANMYIHDGPPSNITEGNYALTQGALESSNTNPVSAMSDLITAHRTYEAMQKAIESHDKSMEITSNKIGNVNG